MLYRVLGSYHHEWGLHLMRQPVNGHLPLFHYLEQRCLCFGRSAVISSINTMLLNTGPARNWNDPACWLSTLVPNTSLGIRSGVNWMRENRVLMSFDNIL